MARFSPHRPVFKNTRRRGQLNPGAMAPSIPVVPPTVPVLVLRGYVTDLALNGATGCVADPAGTYVYVMAAANDSITTVNVSDPDNPVVVGTPLVDAVVLADAFAGIHIGGNALLVTSRLGDSVAAIDVSTPTAPTMLDSVTDISVLNGAVAIGLDAVNQVAFVIANNANRIVSVDYSNLSALSVISSLQDGPSFSNPWAIAVDSTNQIAYLPSYNNDRINSVNIANPAAMTLIQSKQEVVHLNSAWGCALSPDLTKLYVACDGGRITVMDVSDPSNMTVVGTPLNDFPHLDGAQGILVYNSSYIFVNAYFDQEVTVVDVSDPANAAYSSSIVDALAFDGNWGIDRLNNFLYVASDSGGTLAVVEIT